MIYTKKEIQRVKALAMKIPGAKRVSHIHPRAYVVAKPSPGCAVVVYPWQDSEIQVRQPEYSGNVIYSGVTELTVGEWVSVAYVVFDNRNRSEQRAFPL